MSTQQPEALAQECADYATSLRSAANVAKLEGRAPPVSFLRAADLFERAASRITELEAQLAQRFDAADMATAAARGFRDGVTSVSAGSETVAKGLSDPIDALRWGANVAETLLSIGRAIGFGRAQQILGEQWEAAHDCAPRGRMGVTVGKCNPPKLWTQRSQDAYRRGWNDYAAAHPSPPDGMAGWISVDERLPEKNTKVLICFAELSIPSTGQYTASALDHEGWCYPQENRLWPGERPDFEDGGSPTVTHWMPLPAVPGPADGESNE